MSFTVLVSSENYRVPKNITVDGSKFDHIGTTSKNLIGIRVPLNSRQTHSVQQIGSTQGSHPFSTQKFWAETPQFHLPLNFTPKTPQFHTPLSSTPKTPQFYTPLSSTPKSFGVELWGGTEKF